MQLKFVDKAHAITKDVADFGMKDEIYYEMDMRPDVHALATAPTPKKKDDGFEEQTQLWTYEKPGAQRAFVFIPGHTYVNFSRPDVKLLLLRGIAWAGRQSPSERVEQAAKMQICVFPGVPEETPKK
jgi:type 1 glutamine amidotransferase